MLWATYYQQIINYHWMSYLANASLCSERHPDTQLTWLTTVLLKWPISVHVFKLAIVPWLLFTQCRDNKACKLRQVWVKRVFPTLSCTELHNFCDFDIHVGHDKKLFSLIWLTPNLGYYSIHCFTLLGEIKGIII